MRATLMIVAASSIALLFAAPPPQAHADAGRCYNHDVMRGSGHGDWYLCLGDPSRQQPGWWHHIVPTFDVNSADGYGPTQLLPPLCVRFPTEWPDCSTERYTPGIGF